MMISKLVRIICAYADIEGMKAENLQREHLGQSMAYGDTDFFYVTEKYRLKPRELNICYKCGLPIELQDEWIKSGALNTPTKYFHESCINSNV